MTTENFRRLTSAVIAASVAKDWAAAVLEWDVTELEEDPTGSGECACGQQELVLLFTITNKRNGAKLYPIGSTCVQKFGRTDLNRQVTLYSDLFRLRAAILNNTQITLTSNHFSRAMIEYLNDEGAFTPDRWDSDGGYAFMLDMFNKHKKDEFTRPQLSKITVLLNRKVIPFVLADKSLG
ncbi:transcriptional regulator [Microbacterium sp. MYb45]|uniref:transcriptional regulator n=1 Tax=Microbacterium sp. MYb45 TaxID=1827294 RepID=UPI0011B0F3E5|nr:transcriptional regulator [Microbacterium sp. MYb45]